ncbi:MAG: hypothetical protein J6R18_05190, partial [Kiritimatiellae bacterium]|nr:hypothetical protein [Kiritimatiellia bacterium]
LADYTYQIVSAALQTYIMAGHAFAPTPGQLVATIQPPSR